jgi:hypothetical protein
MTREQALQLVGRLVQAFPRQQVGEGTVRIYVEHLEDFDLEPAALAVRKLEAEGTFFPSIAELRRAITALANPAPEIPDGDEAWGQVMAEVRRVGWQGTPDLAPLVAETVGRMVPFWQDICEGNPEIQRPHFLRLYESCARRHQRQQDHAALPGAVREALTTARTVPSRPQLPAPPPNGHRTPELVEKPGALSDALAQVGRDNGPGEPPEVVEARRAASLAALERIASEDGDGRE